MPAAKLNISIEQGATFTKRLVWRDKNKRPVPLTGYTAKMQVRPSATSANVILELSTANGRITFPGPGVVQLDVAANDTDAITSGVYDLKLYAPSGQEIRFIEGKLTVTPGVTKDGL
jgi:hypothetical protein